MAYSDYLSIINKNADTGVLQTVKKGHVSFRDMWPFHLAGLQMPGFIRIVVDVGLGPENMGKKVWVSKPTLLVF